MGKYLFRIENLLLLFPLLFLLLENAFYKDGILDIHLHDTYIVVHISYLIAGVLIFFLLPYFLHVILRWKQRRNNIICRLHIMLTILLSVYFAIITVVEYKFQQAGYVISVLLGLQILFVIYFWFVYWSFSKFKKDA